MSLEKRIEALESATPRGFATFDADDKPVIKSDLPALDWLLWARGVLETGRKVARVALLDQLARSARAADGSRLHELLWAKYAHSVSEEER